MNILTQPAVVANLWDVTDGDLDRFFIRLLASWQEDSPVAGAGAGTVASGGASLLGSVTAARSACKTPWLVGAAPVVYGLPTLLG